MKRFSDFELGWTEYRYFPVHVGVSDDGRRKQLEAETISALRRGAFAPKCMNQEQFVPTRRTRHLPKRTPPSGPPKNQPQLPVTSRFLNTVKHLNSLHDRNRFAELSKMRDSTLSALKRFVPAPSELGKEVRGVAAARQNAAQREKMNGLKFLVTWASLRMQHVNLRRLLGLSAAEWPLDRKLLDTVRFVYKPLAPRGFRNHVDCSLDAFDLPTTCQCHEVDDKFKVGNHVLTASPEVFMPHVEERFREPLRWLFEEGGPKFRTDLHALKVLASIRQDVEAFLEAAAAVADTPVPDEKKKAWVEAMCTAISTEYYSKAPTVRAPVGKLNIREVMKKVHSMYVLAPADKNAQNTVVWCKCLYRQSLTAHLEPPVFREVTDRTYMDVMREHQDIALTFGKEAYDTLPYIYKLAKIHKLEQNPDRPPSRPIAGKSVKNKEGDPSERRGVNSLTAVHRQVAKMLQSVMDLLIIRDQQSPTGIRYCWFVRTTQRSLTPCVPTQKSRNWKPPISRICTPTFRLMT